MEEPENGATPHPSVIASDALDRQRPALHLAGEYIGATLNARFRGQDVILEGTVTATITVRDRATGQMLGAADTSVPVGVATQFQAPADTNAHEVSPGG